MGADVQGTYPCYYGGRAVTNPSEGLMSKGHTLGALGLAQCAELAGQLRGFTRARQVEGARTAPQHNIGIGSSCVVIVSQLLDEAARVA